jgi:hypothetical protein
MITMRFYSSNQTIEWTDGCDECLYLNYDWKTWNKKLQENELIITDETEASLACKELSSSSRVSTLLCM